MTEETLVLGTGDFSVARRQQSEADGGPSKDIWLVFKHQVKKEEMKISINLSSLIRQSHSHKVKGLTPEQEHDALLAVAPKQVHVYRRKAVFHVCERTAEDWFDAIGSYQTVSQIEAQAV